MIKAALISALIFGGGLFASKCTINNTSAAPAIVEYGL